MEHKKGPPKIHFLCSASRYFYIIGFSPSNRILGEILLLILHEGIGTFNFSLFRAFLGWIQIKIAQNWPLCRKQGAPSFDSLILSIVPRVSKPLSKWTKKSIFREIAISQLNLNKMGWDLHFCVLCSVETHQFGAFEQSLQ